MAESNRIADQKDKLADMMRLHRLALMIIENTTFEEYQIAEKRMLNDFKALNLAAFVAQTELEQDDQQKEPTTQNMLMPTNMKHVRLQSVAKMIDLIKRDVGYEESQELKK